MVLISHGIVMKICWKYNIEKYCLYENKGNKPLNITDKIRTYYNSEVLYNENKSGWNTYREKYI